MTEDKNLRITKFGNTFKDENEAETIKVILPKIVNGVDIRECHIYFNFINKSGEGYAYDLTPYVADLSEELCVAEMPMYQMFTHEQGNVEVWIKVLHSQTEMVAKTNSVIYTIKENKEIEDVMPPQDLSVLDRLVIKLDTVSERVDDIATGEEQIIQPMFVGKIHKDESEENND